MRSMRAAYVPHANQTHARQSSPENSRSNRARLRIRQWPRGHESRKPSQYKRIAMSRAENMSMYERIARITRRGPVTRSITRRHLTATTADIARHVLYLGSTRFSPVSPVSPVVEPVELGPYHVNECHLRGRHRLRYYGGRQGTSPAVDSSSLAPRFSLPWLSSINVCPFISGIQCHFFFLSFFLFFFF